MPSLPREHLETRVWIWGDRVGGLEAPHLQEGEKQLEGLSHSPRRWRAPASRPVTAESSGLGILP